MLSQLPSAWFVCVVILVSVSEVHIQAVRIELFAVLVNEMLCALFQRIGRVFGFQLSINSGLENPIGELSVSSQPSHPIPRLL